MRTKILCLLLVAALAACQNSRVTTAGPETAGTGATVMPTPTVTAEPLSTTTRSTVVTVAPTTTAPRSPPTTPPAPPPAAVTRPGDQGPAVTALQERLTALGYWLGGPDGSYGAETTHAVTAFQKASGLSRDGLAGPATTAALERATRVQPVSTSGHVVEVDLRRQLLIVADGGTTTWVFDTSTGAVAGTTPTGHFQVQREVNGWDHGPYGDLYRPKYFHQGVAVHGYPSVPPAPASHGCVRVTNAAIDHLWATDVLAIGTSVWVY